MELETMEDFFTKRIGGYDAHMLEEVPGCREGYQKVAASLPQRTEHLLDLGCGTGLELEEIFRRFPDAKVTCVDLTPSMLKRLADKYPDKNIALVHADYFDFDFGAGAYDAVVAVQTMHHFTHTQKCTLYQKILRALKQRGLYLECDYIAETQEEEDGNFAELARLRAENGLPEHTFFHFDTPCTLANQIRLLKEAGFLSAAPVWQYTHTALTVSQK